MTALLLVVRLVLATPPNPPTMVRVRGGGEREWECVCECDLSCKRDSERSYECDGDL